MTVTTVQNTVDGAELRRAMGHWATGISVITTDHAGTVAGLVSNSFTSVSLEPALVSWAVDKRSSSFDVWNSTDNFAVHILSESDRGLVQRFVARGTDKFAGLAWEPGALGSPIVADDVPRIECRLWQRVDAGDHVILIGEAVSVSDPESFRPLTNHVYWAK
ncbi:flavin reductase family protein [Sinomonas sp. ASV322]|uniref:flavin reductase family protein n=1 Tax=Sinomonas sp. ASV322 TaxID=3041920 RepID=UPI0027DE3003|nr:flavin reductase family protein [Sinomonas sp. ASV322]MDQ4504170.1 flavin reductase family protein [Sinomonas sp. ASV322]